MANDLHEALARFNVLRGAAVASDGDHSRRQRADGSLSPKSAASPNITRSIWAARRRHSQAVSRGNATGGGVNFGILFDARGGKEKSGTVGSGTGRSKACQR